MTGPIKMALPPQKDYGFSVFHLHLSFIKQSLLRLQVMKYWIRQIGLLKE